MATLDTAIARVLEAFAIGRQPFVLANRMRFDLPTAQEAVDVFNRFNRPDFSVGVYGNWRGGSGCRVIVSWGG